MDFSVYILFSEKLNRYYIGQTIDLQERIKQHNSGFYNDASTKNSNDWKLFWSLECDSRKQAIQIESHIKRMRNKVYYQNLVTFPEISEKLLLRYK
jgi:putative endonuclease